MHFNSPSAPNGPTPRASKGKAPASPLLIGSIFVYSSLVAACGGGGGESSSSPRIDAPTVTLSASPLSLLSGATTVLTWNSTDATACSASGAWSGAKGTSGAETSGALAATTSFTLSCTGGGGTSSKSVTVTVSSPPPTLLLTATPASVSVNQSTTLVWSTTDATACVASGAWSGNRAVSGSEISAPLGTDSAFTLDCSGPGGAIQQSIQVIVQQPPPQPTLQFSATPSAILQGESSTLTWNSTNASFCDASGAWAGPRGLSGNDSSGLLETTSIFTLACTSAGGATVSVTAIVTVQIALPTLSFSADPGTVTSGSTTTLNWSTTNATSCTASGGWSGAKSANGSQIVGPLTAATDYLIDCQGPGGSATSSVRVGVTEPPPTVTLTASPTSVASGETSTLTWSATNATSCAATGGWSGAKATSGSEVVGPMTATTNYSLECSGAGGSRQQTTTVSFAPSLPVVTLSASPTSINPGESSTLSWSTTNATTCNASGGWSGSVATAGVQPVGPINQTTEYFLTCTGPGGDAANNVIVTVIGLAPPTVSLRATPSTVALGTVTVLSWTSEDALTCEASGDWAGPVATGGEQLIGPLTIATMYTLTCDGNGGSTSQSVFVSMLATPPPSPSTEIRLRNARFVEVTGRAGHEGWFQTMDQPVTDADLATFRLALFGPVADVNFELVDVANVLVQSITLKPDPDGTGMTSIYQGAFSLPSQAFKILARGTSTSAQPFSVVSQTFTPVTFGVKWPTKELRVLSDSTLNIPILLVNTGAARTFHLDVFDDSYSLATLPIIPDQIVSPGNTTVIVEFQFFPLPGTSTSLTLTLTISEVGNSTETNSSSMSVEIDASN